MTDLLHILPDFPIRLYSHLLHSLERSLITIADILTLDALELAKRAQLPLLDVRRLKEHVLVTLQGQLGIQNGLSAKFANGEELGSSAAFGALRKRGDGLITKRGLVKTLDPRLDDALGGGISTGCITELTGESGAGKTQFLLTLLLSAQLSAPHGLGRSSCYISTEHALPTSRVDQILNSQAFTEATEAARGDSDVAPSMSRILTLQTPDLESQEHILTYQVPIAIQRHQIGLIVIDSIAANFRADRAESTASTAATLAVRSTQLLRLGALLQKISREHDCAIVVSNQVADRFENEIQAPEYPSSAPSGTAAFNNQQTQVNFNSSPIPTSNASSGGGIPAPVDFLRPPNAAHGSQTWPLSTLNPMTLDHQLRFFTGWGDNREISRNLKTPSLGLVWANQLSARITLIKERNLLGPGVATLKRGQPISGNTEFTSSDVNHAEWAPRHWRRWMRVVFATWTGGVSGDDAGEEFEIYEGGLRTIA